MAVSGAEPDNDELVAAAPKPAPRSFLFTLYGDYSQPLAPEGAWIGGLVRLAGDFGISSMALRSAVSRMTREGWLVARRDHGRPLYKLSSRGTRLIEEGVQRIYQGAPEPWDGRWLIVSYSVPERKRNQRDRIRTTLSFLGFGSIANGVYVSARDRRDEVLRVINEQGVESEVSVHFGDLVWPEPESRLVTRAWRLKELSTQYLKFTEGCRAALIEVRRQLRLRQLTDQDAFRRRFQLTHEYRHLLFGDPDLPPELLPSNWTGHAARRIFLDFNRLLEPAAKRYFAAVMKG
jgi:phenylacetic acid degradation operon negative regulatory protein